MMRTEAVQSQSLTPQQQYQREWRRRNPEYHGRYVQQPKWKEYYRQYQKAYWTKPEVKEKYKPTKRRHDKIYKKREEVKLHTNAFKKVKRQQDRKKLMILLGGMKCTRCGNDDIRVLQIDHVHNDGAADRRRFNKRTGRSNGSPLFYSYYLKHSTEAKTRLQVLCANCNWLKREEQTVTHQQKVTNNNLVNWMI